MRYIDLSKINTEEPRFQDWQRKAEEKNAELHAKRSHEERADYFEHNAHWKNIKVILRDTYGNICWYSGSDLSNSHGDVDHFRPKNESCDIDGHPILNDGYWWLAYNYMNYRLSCTVCNSRCDNGGKGIYFPIRNINTAADVDSMCENEEPLLLDPCNKHDTELVGYLENGEVFALTENPWQNKRVKKSVELYNLKRFTTARRRIVKSCRVALRLFDSAYRSQDDEESLKEALEQIIELVDEKSPYSSVARYFLKQGIEGKEYERDLHRIICSDEYELTVVRT